MDVRTPQGEPVKDETFMMLFNAHHEAVVFTLAGKQDVSWELILNTELESGFLEMPTTHSSGDEMSLMARSMCLLRLVKGSQEDARSASWKHRQKAAPAEPPAPPRVQRTFRDATTTGPKQRPAPAVPTELQGSHATEAADSTETGGEHPGEPTSEKHPRASKHGKHPGRK
jgi:glycogen operon protein